MEVIPLHVDTTPDMRFETLEEAQVYLDRWDTPPRTSSNSRSRFDLPRFVTMFPRSVMPFAIYGHVILTRDVSERGLRTGDLGTVVERHAASSVSEEGYSVGSST